jgi:hypothetical protein
MQTGDLMTGLPTVNLGPGRGSWFPEFSPDERYVSLRRYNDHHPQHEASSRIDGGLAKYFHFEVSNADNGSCFETDDPKAVGKSVHRIRIS